MLGRPAAAADRLDQISVHAQADGQRLTWSDTENQLDGLVTPNPPREGQPLEVSLQLNAFEGPSFSEPVTLSFRDASGRRVANVVAARERNHYRVRFAAPEEGLYALDVLFQSGGRTKLLHAMIPVEPPKVPRWIGLGLLGLLIAGGMGLTARRVLGRDKVSAS